MTPKGRLRKYHSSTDTSVYPKGPPESMKKLVCFYGQGGHKAEFINLALWRGPGFSCLWGVLRSRLFASLRVAGGDIIGFCFPQQGLTNRLFGVVM